MYIQEIHNIITTLDAKKLKEVSNFIKYIKYKDDIDPTLELLENKVWYNQIKQGLSDMEANKTLNWDDVK